jgi:hypothetical protein
VSEVKFPAMATRPELLTTEQKPPFFFLSELTREEERKHLVEFLLKKIMDPRRYRTLELETN